MAKDNTVMPTPDEDLEARAAEALNKVKAKAATPTPEENMDDTTTIISSEETGAIDSSEVKQHVDEAINATAAGDAASQDDDDDLYVIMGDMPKEAQDDFLARVNPEIEAYRKELILKHGFTPAEAAEASRKRLETKAKERNDQYLEENPRVGVIEVDATNAESVKDVITDDMRDKLHKVQALRLVMVENKELETVTILPRDEDKTRYRLGLFRGINKSLSHYSVPMPCLGDYLTFNGAQTITLLGATALDQDSSYTALEKKARLLYEQFWDGTVTHKYAPNGDVAMSFEEFCNLYKFDDVAMGVYAIAVASSMEVSKSTMRCINPRCGKDFEYEYNLKSLLDMSGINEYYQQRVETIDKKRNHPDSIQEIVTEHQKELRMKSPVSNNLYTLCYPSLAKALQVYEKFDETDIKQYGVIILAMYLSEVLIWSEENQGYYKVDMDDIEELVEVLSALPQLDINLINKQLTDRTYSPRFVMRSVCSHCKNEAVEDISMDQILFLKARDSSMEIR